MQVSQIIKDIIECETQDESGLNDFQKLVSNQGIFIPQVGITRFRLPILLQYPNQTLRSHDATASMYISLAANKTGVNMSRLCVILQRETLDTPITQDLLRQVLDCYQEELKDGATDAPIENCGLKLSFSYAIKQPSLKSNNWGWQYYPVTLEAKQTTKNGTKKFQFFISLTFEYSSTCPCSLSMAKQYERDYQTGKTSEGSGIGAAHAQRSQLRCKVEVNPNSTFFIPELLQLIRSALPTETQSLVKRVDEQAFAILNGNYPMFVEHACRMLYDKFSTCNEFIDWIANFEHFESLHGHNAAATIFKGVPGGLHHGDLF